MAMLGSVQLPDWKVWVLGVVPEVTGAPNAAFSHSPRFSTSIGTTTSPSAVTASLIGASGSRPWPSSSEAINGCSEPSVVLANGTVR